MSEKKKEVKKVKLSVNLKHPAKAFRLGKHVIKATPEIFSLDENELAELNTAGPKAWIIIHENKTSEVK